MHIFVYTCTRTGTSSEQVSGKSTYSTVTVFLGTRLMKNMSTDRQGDSIFTLLNFVWGEVKPCNRFLH